MGTKRWGENACAKGVMGTKRSEEGDWGQKGRVWILQRCIFFWRIHMKKRHI